MYCYFQVYYRYINPYSTVCYCSIATGSCTLAGLHPADWQVDLTEIVGLPSPECVHQKLSIDGNSGMSFVAFTAFTDT